MLSMSSNCLLRALVLIVEIPDIRWTVFTHRYLLLDFDLNIIEIKLNLFTRLTSSIYS